MYLRITHSLARISRGSQRSGRTKSARAAAFFTVMLAAARAREKNERSAASRYRAQVPRGVLTEGKLHFQGDFTTVCVCVCVVQVRKRWKKLSGGLWVRRSWQGSVVTIFTAIKIP